jgi:hypothetical protein
MRNLSVAIGRRKSIGKGFRLGTNGKNTIYKAIEATNTFIFVLTPPATRIAVCKRFISASSFGGFFEK